MLFYIDHIGVLRESLPKPLEDYYRHNGADTPPTKILPVRQAVRDTARSSLTLAPKVMPAEVAVAPSRTNVGSGSRITAGCHAAKSAAKRQRVMEHQPSSRSAQRRHPPALPSDRTDVVDNVEHVAVADTAVVGLLSGRCGRAHRGVPHRALILVQPLAGCNRHGRAVHRSTLSMVGIGGHHCRDMPLAASVNRTSC